MSPHPGASGAADAAALLARAARNDVAGTHELAARIMAGDSARECLLALAFLGGGFAAACGDMNGGGLDQSLDHAAQVACEVVAAIENRESREDG